MFSFCSPPMISPSKPFKPTPLSLPTSEAAAAAAAAAAAMQINYPPMFAAGEHERVTISQLVLVSYDCSSVGFDII